MSLANNPSATTTNRSRDNNGSMFLLVGFNEISLLYLARLNEA
jgi:hypothetical protein